MKIALIGWGHVDSVLPLANGIIKKGHSISIYLLFDQNHKGDSLLNFEQRKVNNGFLNKESVRSILGREINDILDSRIDINIFILNSPKVYDIKNIILLYKLSRNIIKKRYDVVNINGNNMLESWLHLLLNRYPRIQTIHDPLPHSGEGGRLTNHRNKLLSKINTEYIFHGNSLMYQYHTKYKVNLNRMHTVYYGSLDFYKVYQSNGDTKSHEPIVLFYGRIVKYKGIEYLIAAMKKVKEDIPDAKLVIAGSGQFYFNIDEIIKDKSFEIINRYITNSELVNLIEKSIMVVCPYTDATQSGVILTSYAFNKPIVASAVGGIPEVVEHNITGILVPPKDINALAESIKKMILNKSLRDKILSNIVKVKKNGKLSWNKIADQTLEVYRKAINRKYL